MQDMEKAERITRLAYEIYHLNQFYQIQRCAYYFDYNAVIETLQTALQQMENTLCCERSGDCPRPRRDSCFDGGDPVDLYEQEW